MSADSPVALSISMDTSSPAEPKDTPSGSKTSKRRNMNTNETTAANKRSKLLDMVFYDGNRHPAAVLHELHPEISSEKYTFQPEDGPSKQARFRCTVIIDQNVAEPVHCTGVGRSKQLAKNMAAQQALIKLYSTYRPPEAEILTEDFDMYQQGRFVSTRPPSLQNDPTLLIESIRKHLTVKSIAIKTPLQLFHELFVNNQRLNASATTRNRVELIENEENLVLVRVTAMDQQFWSVGVAKSVAQNDACQQAIETLCNISFRQAKDEFIRALQSMNRITLPAESTTDSNNNINSDRTTEEQQEGTESTLIPGVSASFLQPLEEA